MKRAFFTDKFGSFFYQYFGTVYLFVFVFVNAIESVRLIPGIDMGIACMYTTKSGAKRMVVSHFSTGKQRFSSKKMVSKDLG